MAAPAPTSPFVMHGAREAFAAGLTRIEDAEKFIGRAD